MACLFDVIQLTVAKYEFPVGTEGTIVHIYTDDPPAYELEISNGGGETLGLFVIREGEFVVKWRNPKRWRHLQKYAGVKSVRRGKKTMYPPILTPAERAAIDSLRNQEAPLSLPLPGSNRSVEENGASGKGSDDPSGVRPACE